MLRSEDEPRDGALTGGRRRRAARALAAALLVAGWLPDPAGALTFPDRPPAAHYYVDEAGLLDAQAARRVDETAAALLREQRVPLFVVTIRSLASHDAVTLTIEEYARALFDHWGIGSPDRNYGMLLLVSERDRKARIELGADWGGDHDREAGQIMGKLVVPAFRRGDYATGIADGVRGMDALARGLALPAPQAPWWVLPVMIGVPLLLVALIVDLFRKGRKGWAWALIALLGVLLVFFIRAALAGAGSAGGFGGGSSGGGGATGSW